jgi:hypothetical protein
MQAYAGSEVATGSWRDQLTRMILGRLAPGAPVAPVRAGGNAHCEYLLRVEGQNAQRRNEEMNE